MDVAPPQGWNEVHESDPLFQPATPHKPVPSAIGWRQYARPALLAMLVCAAALTLLVTTDTGANTTFRAYASLGVRDGQCVANLFHAGSEVWGEMMEGMAHDDVDAAKATAAFVGEAFPDYEAHFVNFDQSTDTELTFYGADGTPYADNTWHTLQGPTAVADLVAIFAQLQDRTGVRLLKPVAFGVDHIGLVGHTKGLAPAASHSLCSNVDEADVLRGTVFVTEATHEFEVRVEEAAEDQDWRLVMTSYDARDADGTCKVRCFVLQIYDTAA